MYPVALFPDGELVALTWLRAALAARPEPYAAGVTVATKLPPATSPGRHVRLRRLGGGQLHVVADSPRIQAQVWFSTGGAADEKSRNDLAQLVWALLRGIRGQSVTIPGWPAPVACYRVATFSGPIPVPDPVDASRTISQLAVEIAMRGRAL
ncbi:hypothetical protein CSH63_17925 [Micromonospora tulbaghiae]|uniref:Tail terminator n=1 Tax=Micromonospora tulbaghiae TaxID=479978 RepID=A0A386WPG8_9ACTN|nr:hypothetical protein [Micromonospora tulbaghiae]AYF29309.1 hypothetical protein CSH63_17925 [Micromonospora tulbaghiae]